MSSFLHAKKACLDGHQHCTPWITHETVMKQDSLHARGSWTDFTGSTNTLIFATTGCTNDISAQESPRDNILEIYRTPPASVSAGKGLAAQSPNLELFLKISQLLPAPGRGLRRTKWGALSTRPSGADSQASQWKVSTQVSGFTRSHTTSFLLFSQNCC